MKSHGLSISKDRFFFALFLLAFVPRLALAQETKSPVVLDKVLYSHVMPRALRAYLPRGRKTRFWGASRLNDNGQKVWIHVYDIQKAQYRKGEENLNSAQKSHLDLFIWPKSGRLKRICSVPFSYPRYGGYKKGGTFETVAVQTYWLDLKTRQNPLIRIEMQDPNGLYGTIADDVFVVFKPGFKSAVVQQQFGYGESNGAGWNSWATSFGTDERGLLTVIYGEGSSSGSRITTYKWDINSFKPFERKQKGMDEGDQYAPVPLTDN